MSESNLTDLLPAEKHYQPPGMFKSLLDVPGVVMLVIILTLLSTLHTFELIPPVATVVVFAMVTTGYVGMYLWHVRKGINLIRQGVQDLKSGNIEVASAIFEDLSRNFRSHPYHALFVHNRGVCYLIEGHPRTACALFNAVRASKRLTRFKLRQFQHFPTTQLALALGLLGEVREANAVLSKAEQDPGSYFGMTVIPRAIIYLRQGQSGSALEHLSRHGTEAEGVVSARSAKALRILREFAASRSGQTAEIERLVKDIGPRDVEWLWVDWPELESFAAEYL